MPKPKAPAARTTSTRDAKATVSANFRFPAALVSGLDDWVTKLNAKNPLGRKWTRTDVAQEVLAQALRTYGTLGKEPGNFDPTPEERDVIERFVTFAASQNKAPKKADG